MTPTDLPQAARARIEAQRTSGVAGSLLSAPGAAALRGAGLEPAGEVFGCVVMNVGWAGSAGCGLYSGAGLGMGYGWVSPVITTEGGGWTAFGPYITAFERAWHDAVRRMLLEAAALGAEGVVDVRIARTRLAGSAWEYTALGTAVRVVDASLVGHDPQRRVWAADLSAEDVAAAIHSGRRPAGIALGIAIATKHEDTELRTQRSSWTGTEVTGLSELLFAARDAARNRVTASAKRLGSGGTLVLTATGTQEFDTACGDRETDLHAETVMQGTVLVPAPLAAFRTADRPGTANVLSVLPLSDRTRGVR